MPKLLNTPYLMDVFAEPSQANIPSASILIKGDGAEPRHSCTFGCPVQSISISKQELEFFEHSYSGSLERVNIRSRKAIERFLVQLPDEVYIDITSLAHHVWASLIRGAVTLGKLVRAVYVEPNDYISSPTGIDGEIFDLSDKIQGLSAIPGFATISDASDDNVCFVPLLGFEGKRLAFIFEQIQAQGTSIAPIVGLPGFRVEYPLYAYQSNARFLRETQAWRNIYYAAANNPFSAYEALCEIDAKHKDHFLKIAPIGTKPHALGAFLYPLKTHKRVEFIYDFPIRRTHRTTGTSRLLVYRISEFLA